MENSSAPLALCEGNPPVIDEFPSHRPGNVELWCFRCSSSQQAADQVVDLQGLDSHMTQL